MENMTPLWLKQITRSIGAVLVILGFPFAINLLCLVPLALLGEPGNGTTQFGIFSLVFVLLTVGVGLAAYWHADRSLKNNPSNPMRLPSTVVLVAAFLPLLLLGIIMQTGDVGFLFIPILVLCAILPPVWALAWMIPQVPANTVQNSSDDLSVEQGSAKVEAPDLTWRRGLLVFCAGATVSVLIALVLELLFPVVILSLVSDLAVAVTVQVRSILEALSNSQIAEAVTDPGFLFIFIQIAVIAPIAEEIAKPLVLLPLLKDTRRQEAFWLGALAGAGFAALENVIYAGAAVSMWGGILLVRALGAGLHPLCAGLVAVGWRDFLHQEKNANSNWWRRFGMAVAIHAVWNGGSLLVITLGSAGFFGELPPALDVLGVSAAGIVLGFLLILGIAALWVGRSYGHDRSFLDPGETTQRDVSISPSDRAVAVWALICLAALLPIGIAGLKLWLP